MEVSPGHSLSLALMRAVEGDEIVLACGTYCESRTIEVPAGVTLKGGGEAVTILESSAQPAIACVGNGSCVVDLCIRCSQSMQAAGSGRTSRPTSRCGVPPAASRMITSAAELPEKLQALLVEEHTGVQISRCRILGGDVSLGKGAVVLLDSNELVGGGVQMRGTAAGCELRANTICNSGGSGLLLVAHAAGTLVENRILCSAGAGIEVTGGAAPCVLRNEIAGTQGVGLLVHSGGGGEFRENTVRGAHSRAAEICGRGLSATTMNDDKLLDSVGGVGVLLHGGTTALLNRNEVAGHSLAGIEIGEGSAPTITACTVRRCGQTGVLITAGAAGTLRANRIEGNAGNGIECSSGEQAALHLESNVVSGHRRGAGLLVRSGGRGVWTGNTLSGNAVGAELHGEGTEPELRRNKILSNLRAGVHVRLGARVVLVECQIRANGNECIVSGGRRGERTVGGDDAGAGVIVHGGGEARMEGNTLSANAGAGVFSHAGAHVQLTGNVFRGNRGDAVRARPASSTMLSDADARCSDHQRAVTPTVVRRQRVPFDWTVGDNVSADDKTLADRTAEMRAQYHAMSGDKTSGLAMLPPGVDPTSAVCVVC